MLYQDSELQSYLEKIKEYKVLDANVQKELVAQAQKGDEAAREKLIMSNLRFVVSFAIQYKNVIGITLSELISEGNMGLITAVDKFDVSKPIHFTSYAAWWIRHYILRAIHQYSKTVRLPMNKVRLIQKIKRTQQLLIVGLEIGDEEALSKAGEEYELNFSQVASLYANSQEAFSLDREMNSEQDRNITFLDSLIDENLESIDDQIDFMEERDFITYYLNKIPQREADIISLRYGLKDTQPLSLKAISTIYGVTKERVRQIEMKGVQRLKDLYHSKQSKRRTALHIA